jgi:hypothetical protein
MFATVSMDGGQAKIPGTHRNRSTRIAHASVLATKATAKTR